MPSAPSELLTAGELAPHFGVTADTVAQWAREGKIPTAITTPGGHRRFRLAECEEAARAAAEANAAERAAS